MVQYRFTIVVEQDEDGVFIGSCPAMQGCYAQGDTYDEVVANLEDVVRLHVEARRSQGEPIPIEIAIDKVEVSV